MTPFRVYAPGQNAQSAPWDTPGSYVYFEGAEALNLKLTNLAADGLYFTSFGPAVRDGVPVGLFVGTYAAKPPGSLNRLTIHDDDGTVVQVIRLAYDGPSRGRGDVMALAAPPEADGVVTIARAPTKSPGSKYKGS